MIHQIEVAVKEVFQKSVPIKIAKVTNKVKVIFLPEQILSSPYVSPNATNLK